MKLPVRVLHTIESSFDAAIISGAFDFNTLNLLAIKPFKLPVDLNCKSALYRISANYVWQRLAERFAGAPAAIQPTWPVIAYYYSRADDPTLYKVFVQKHLSKLEDLINKTANAITAEH